MKTNDYIQQGLANNDCDTITQWLDFLSVLYDVPFDQVKMMAQVVGPSELFDGLVSSLQDLTY